MRISYFKDIREKKSWISQCFKNIMWCIFLEKVGNSVWLSYLMYTALTVKILWNIYKLTRLFTWPFTVKLHWVQLLLFIHLPKLSTTILCSKTFHNNFDLNLHTVESVCDDFLLVLKLVEVVISLPVQNCYYLPPIRSLKLCCSSFKLLRAHKSAGNKMLWESANLPLVDNFSIQYHC